MATPSIAISPKILEDPLAYLPHATVHRYPGGQNIYVQNEPSTSIYLVIEGKVKVCCVAENGSQAVIDIYRTDEFFGESALLGLSQPRNDTAIAVENTKVMAWTLEQIEEITTRRPQLAIALIQFCVRRSENFEERIQSFSVDSIARRLARALLHFSERMGHETEEGSVEMDAFTHELLAQCIGTTRENVTLYMNQFRRQGYLRYSRRSILLRPELIQDWLRAEPWQPEPGL